MQLLLKKRLVSMAEIQKKYILFVLPFLPYPLTSGGHQALFNGIMAVNASYNVFVAYKGVDDEGHFFAQQEFLRLLPNVTLCPCLMPKPERPSWKIRFIWTVRHILDRLLGTTDSHTKTVDATLGNWWLKSVTPTDRKWAEHIDALCKKYNFDIIQVEMPWMISDVFCLPNNVKKIFVHHELGFVRRELEIVNAGNNAYAEACRSFADFNEIGQLNKYDAIVSLSPIDSEKLHEAGVTVPIHTSFAIVDTSKELVLPSKVEKRLTFIGPDAHTPNFVGIKWFLENCWGKLKAANGEYTLDIIGTWSEDNRMLFSEKYPDIHFLGFVDNLYEVLKGSVMIVPITVGSGIRMKILEACSMGIPFVSTTVGAEGIPVDNGKHCYIADDADTFISYIRKMDCLQHQKDLVSNSYQMVRDNYSLEALTKNRMDIYSSVLS